MMSDKEATTMGAVEDQMTNPSLEYMRRIRREERDKLLDMRRERAVKALRSLDLHGGSHAMLSQIAYAIHPHIGAWDEDACDHLRNVLVELIGGDHEAASGAQHACSCGAGGCHRGHEQTALDSERQEAVSRLRGTFLDTGGALKKLATALGVRWNADNTNKSVASLQRRLIHLLGGDQPRITFDQDALVITNSEHEVKIVKGDVIADGVSFADVFDEMTDGAYSRMFRRQSWTCPESEPDVSEGDDSTSVTKELREWITLHKTKITRLSLDDYSVDEELTEEGKQLVAIADRIDARVAEVGA